MTAVNAAVVTVPSVVLLIYIFITVTIVAKHVIVDTCAVLKKNATVVKFVAETREILAIIPRLIGGFAVSVILGLDVAINADVRSPRIPVKTDRTQIYMYTSHLLIGRNLQRPEKNHGLHKITMMVSYSNSHRDDLVTCKSLDYTCDILRIPGLAGKYQCRELPVVNTGCCSDDGGGDVGHHFASHWWLCFLGDSCDGCCNQRRRREPPDVYVVNAAPVLTPSSVVTAQPPSYEEACENAVTSQPMKS
uniref:Uncharacterized protein n=1 Tax=Magallana gigas TaxID=29159 RepID=K1PT35_MAGGI